MSTVVADMSVSLDGFVADPSDGVERVFAWYGKPQPEPAAGGSGTGGVGKLATAPIDLQDPEITQGNGVTHLYYSVPKRDA